jgi:hypothetical protein
MLASGSAAVPEVAVPVKLAAKTGGAMMVEIAAANANFFIFHIL